MSSGYYTMMPSKLGSGVSAWGPGGVPSAAGLISNRQEFPAGAFAKWQPFGNALSQGLQSGVQEGEQLTKIPTEAKAIQVENQKLANEQQGLDFTSKVMAMEAANLSNGNQSPIGKGLTVDANGNTVFAGNQVPTAGEYDLSQTQKAAGVGQTEAETQKTQAETGVTQQNLISPYQRGMGVAPQRPQSPLTARANADIGVMPPISPLPGATPANAQNGGAPAQTPSSTGGVVTPGQMPSVSGINTNEAPMDPNLVKQWAESGFVSSGTIKGVRWSPNTNSYIIDMGDKKSTQVTPQYILQNMGSWSPGDPEQKTQIQSGLRMFMAGQYFKKVVPQMMSNYQAQRAQPPIGGQGFSQIMPSNQPTAAQAPNLTLGNENAPGAPVLKGPGDVPQPSQQTTPGNDGGTNAKADTVPAASDNGESTGGITATGRIPALGKDGKPLTNAYGQQVWYDPQRNSNYTFDWKANGNEQRYYDNLRTPEERMNGVEYPNPQYQLSLEQDKALAQFLPVQEIAKMTPDQKAGAIQAHQIFTNTKPLDTESIDDLNVKSSILRAGTQVQDALQKLTPQDYNVWKLAAADLGNKFGTTPIVGDLLKKFNGGQAPSPALTQLQQSFNTFMDAVRPGETGKTRMMPQEFEALQKAIGNPADTNWDFKPRFMTALLDRQQQFVDKVDSLGQAGYRMTERNPANGQEVKDANGLPVESPFLKYADVLRQGLANYQKATNKGAAPNMNPYNAQGAYTGVPNAQPSPSATPQASPVQVKTNADVAKLAPGTRIVDSKGHETTVSQAMLDKLNGK
jgi:hypothetical protein